MTHADGAAVRQLFDSLKRAPSTAGRYAPHKPLLLLLALARLQHGQRGPFGFAEVEEPMRQLLTEFGPSNAPNTRHLPYWHLQSDSAGQLWQLQLPDALAQHPKGSAPGVTALRRADVSGGLHPAVEQALQRDPALLVDVAQRLLDNTFPDSLHADIANAIGLDLTPPEPKAEYASAGYEVGTRRRRDKAFRDKVLRAYEYRCCVCGFDLRLGHVPVGLEAAHIQWHNVGGPDIETNGLALCALHHKLFDLGAFTLDVPTLKVVFSEHALAGTRGLSGELQHHGKDLLRPVESDALPAPQFLRWNWVNVFKREARRLG